MKSGSTVLRPRSGRHLAKTTLRFDGTGMQLLHLRHSLESAVMNLRSFLGALWYIWLVICAGMLVDIVLV